MLQAMNTGHDGSGHHPLRQPARYLRRIETMVLLAAWTARRPSRAVASAGPDHHLQHVDGVRRVTQVTSQGMEDTM